MGVGTCLLSGVLPGRPREQRRHRLGKDPHETGPYECRSSGVAPAVPDPSPTDSSLGTSHPSHPEVGACGTVGCQPEGVPSLGQVPQPAICSLPAFYNGIKYGVHTPRHTRSHGNQATGSSLPSPTQSTPAPGCLPDPCEVRQGPVYTTGQSKWETRGKWDNLNNALSRRGIFLYQSANRIYLTHRINASKINISSWLCKLNYDIQM